MIRVVARVGRWARGGGVHKRISPSAAHRRRCQTRPHSRAPPAGRRYTGGGRHRLDVRKWARLSLAALRSGSVRVEQVRPCKQSPPVQRLVGSLAPLEGHSGRGAPAAAAAAVTAARSRWLRGAVKPTVGPPPLPPPPPPLRVWLSSGPTRTRAAEEGCVHGPLAASCGGGGGGSCLCGPRPGPAQGGEPHTRQCPGGSAGPQRFNFHCGNFLF